MTLVGDRTISGAQRELYNDIGESRLPNPGSPEEFVGDLEWSVNQLEWVVDTTKEALH